MVRSLELRAKAVMICAGMVKFMYIAIETITQYSHAVIGYTHTHFEMEQYLRRHQYTPNVNGVWSKLNDSMFHHVTVVYISSLV